MSQPIRVQAVRVVDGFQVALTLTDGSSREVDLETYLRGPVFETIKADPREFRQVFVDPRAGTICWPNGADIDPDVLILGRTPAWMSAAESVAAR